VYSFTDKEDVIKPIIEINNTDDFTYAAFGFLAADLRKLSEIILTPDKGRET